MAKYRGFPDAANDRQNPVLEEVDILASEARFIIHFWQERSTANNLSWCLGGTLNKLRNSTGTT